MTNPDTKSEPSHVIIAVFCVWLITTFIALTMPSFCHPNHIGLGPLFSIGMAYMSYGLICLSTLLTIVRFKKISIGVRIMGFIPVAFICWGLLYTL